MLIFWSILGRGARFFLEALLIVAFGQAVKEFLKGAPFSLLTMSVGFLGLIIYLVYTTLSKKKKRIKNI